MTKKVNISILFLFTFLILLVHNIVPHHHHDNVAEINNHEHHHDNDHHHHQKEKDHHDENDEPTGLFSHPAHILISTEYNLSYAYHFQQTKQFNPFFLITEIVVEPTTVFFKRKPPNLQTVIPLRLFHSNTSLRGPPLFSV